MRETYPWNGISNEEVVSKMVASYTIQSKHSIPHANKIIPTLFLFYSMNTLLSCIFSSGWTLVQFSFGTMLPHPCKSHETSITTQTMYELSYTVSANVSLSNHACPSIQYSLFTTRFVKRRQGLMKHYLLIVLVIQQYVKRINVSLV